MLHLELSRTRVYFARPTIAIAKIRDYWQSIVKQPAANYSVHSSIQSRLFIPKSAVLHSAPILWNSLPLTIRISSSLAIFKNIQKQQKAFNV